MLKHALSHKYCVFTYSIFSPGYVKRVTLFNARPPTPTPPPHTHLSLFHFLPVAGFDMSIFHQCLCTRHSWVSSKYNMTKFITFRPWIVFRDSLSVSSWWDKVLLDTPEPFLCENKLKKHFVRVSRDSVLPLLHAITPPFSCPTVVSHTPLLSLNASVSLFCCGPVLWLK